MMALPPHVALGLGAAVAALALATVATSAAGRPPARPQDPLLADSADARDAS